MDLASKKGVLCGFGSFCLILAALSVISAIALVAFLYYYSESNYPSNEDGLIVMFLIGIAVVGVSIAGVVCCFSVLAGALFLVLASKQVEVKNNTEYELSTV